MKITNRILVLFFVLCPFLLVAQTEKYTWVLMDHQNLDFSHNTARFSCNRKIENLVEVKIVLTTGSVFVTNSLTYSGGKITLIDLNTYLFQVGEMDITPVA